MSLPAARSIPTTMGEIALLVDEHGTGRPIMLLHGGAGPGSVGPFADLLAERHGRRVLTPTHPGFGGTPRPEAVATIGALAELYAAMLDSLDLADVTVIGNSVGGWIAAELALRHSPRVGRLVLVDAVGIEVPGHPVADFFALTPAEVAERSFFDPSRANIPDPATLPRAARDILLGNRAALAVYGGAMTDPSLRARLAAIDVPTRVIWGAADRIADPEYGRTFAASIPTAEFVLLAGTGHVPQLETPTLLLDALDGFA